MKKAELLIPVGNYDCLVSAVKMGADAVYFAGKNFGARKYANNFDDEQIVEAIKYAHLYGVRVYITVNTLIYENEVNSFIRYIEFLYMSGVDALIMQDIGMISLVHMKFPEIEIHASTQVHNTNESGLKYLESLGVKRVVLARELSLDEIKKIDTKMEIEVFIHGALCISYSGQCLFSSLVGGRSGNRGECAGSCRLPYNLYKNNQCIKTDEKYPLSTKELSSIYNLKEILDSGVDSLKVEGRMKGPVYVGFVTKLYRTLIDKYYNNENMDINEQDVRNLSVIFNRQFTKGFLFGEENTNIVNTTSPNHIGIKIGEVVSVKEKIKIKLTDGLNQNDGIRFGNKEGMIVNFLYDERKLLTSSVKKGEVCYLDKNVDAYVGDIVFKTQDYLLNKEILEYKEKKIPVKLYVKAKYNEQLEVSYDGVLLKGTIVQPAITRPTTKEEIIKSLSKLGNTPFEVGQTEGIIDDNIFVSVSELNDLRRKCINLLIERKSERHISPVIKNMEKDSVNVNITNNISVLVRNEDQLEYVLTKNVDTIYVSDYNLFKKYKNDSRVFYRTSRVPKLFNEFNNENLLVSELGAFNKYKENNYVITDAYLNVVNSFTLFNFHKNGAKKVTLSFELDCEQTKRMMEDYTGKYKSKPNVELIVYSHPELMITKYCPINKLLNKDKICTLCKNSNDKYYLEDRVGEKYRILNENCLTYIMHYKPIDLTSEVEMYKNIGVTNFRIELLDESKEEIQEILNKLM